jgi:hypothetical protein
MIPPPEFARLALPWQLNLVPVAAFLVATAMLFWNCARRDPQGFRLFIESLKEAKL